MSGPAGRPPVAVLVATHGRPELVGRTVPGLAAALAQGDELVLVESGQVAGDLPATRIPSDAKGKSTKLNQGLAACGHPIVVLTDDDCAVAPGWVDAMAAPFADPAVGVAFGPVVGLTAVPGSDGPPPIAPGEAPFVTWTYAHGAAMAVRRSAVDEVGGFDERLGPGAPAHGEEHDLVLRLRERGWRCAIADAPPVEHVRWRDDAAEVGNAVVYECGAGALLGAALRRSPRTGARLVAARLGHLRALWRHGGFGPRATAAFAGGLLYGLRLRPWGRARSAR